MRYLAIIALLTLLGCKKGEQGPEGPKGDPGPSGISVGIIEKDFYSSEWLAHKDGGWFFVAPVSVPIGTKTINGFIAETALSDKYPIPMGTVSYAVTYEGSIIIRQQTANKPAVCWFSFDFIL